MFINYCRLLTKFVLYIYRRRFFFEFIYFFFLYIRFIRNEFTNLCENKFALEA